MRDSLNDHHVKVSNPRYQFQGYPIISDQVTKEGLGVVWRSLEQVLARGTAGDIVELGCYAGTTSVFIRRLLNQQASNKAFHVYDSFEGLPPKSQQDNNAAGIDFEAGKLYVSKADFMKVFRGASLQPPVVHKGWFGQLSDRDMPEHIAFAFLDGDFYESILDSLKLVWPRMQSGGIVLIDDYKRETLPGVERAITDFFNGRPPAIQHEHNIAIIPIP